MSSFFDTIKTVGKTFGNIAFNEKSKESRILNISKNLFKNNFKDLYNVIKKIIKIKNSIKIFTKNIKMV